MYFLKVVQIEASYLFPFFCTIMQAGFPSHHQCLSSCLLFEEKEGGALIAGGAVFVSKSCL